MVVHRGHGGDPAPSMQGRISALLRGVTVDACDALVLYGSSVVPVGAIETTSSVPTRHDHGREEAEEGSQEAEDREEDQAREPAAAPQAAAEVSHGRTRSAHSAPRCAERALEPERAGSAP